MIFTKMSATATVQHQRENKKRSCTQRRHRAQRQRAMAPRPRARYSDPPSGHARAFRHIVNNTMLPSVLIIFVYDLYQDVNCRREYKSSVRTRNVLVCSGAAERSDSGRWRRGPERVFGCFTFRFDLYYNINYSREYKATRELGVGL